MHRCACFSLFVVLTCVGACSKSGSEETPGSVEPTPPDADPCINVVCGADEVCRDGGCVSVFVDDECLTQTVCGTPPVCCTESSECIDGTCLAACASGIRCGADRTICCGNEQVCLDNACVDQGAPCDDSFDCARNEYCEPTLARCLPQPEGSASCQLVPEFASFEPLEEWSATEPPDADMADCAQAISMPAVVDLDGDGTPEVVANFGCSSLHDGLLAAYSGEGQLLWSLESPRPHGRSTIAVGDLTGDGFPEIVFATNQRRVAAVTLTGGTPTLLWEADDAPEGQTPNDTHRQLIASSGDYNGAVSIGEIDPGSPGPEVVLGALTISAAGKVLWERNGGTTEGTNNGYNGGISVLADVDTDDAMEVVVGRRVYEADGTEEGYSPLQNDDGYPAVANFDADRQAEIVLVADGKVAVYDGQSGALEWPLSGPRALPGGGRGGPPTIADFDGDGDLEIGIAGAGSYTVYDPIDESSGTYRDGEDVAWSRETKDDSSNATGSSVFDFEGDGAAEVVYQDECYVWVYDGVSGETKLAIPSSSATIHEYPVMVDVDGDNNTEIVVVANTWFGSKTCTDEFGDDWDGHRSGIFVYGDANDLWVRSRRVWNQHAYHVTNVNGDGTIPTDEQRNWEVPGLNNYRQTVQGQGVFNAPDPTIVGLDVVFVACPSQAKLRARVQNAGSLGLQPGVPVSFYSGTPDAPGQLLGTASTTVNLLPGGTTVVELDVSLEGKLEAGVFARVNDDGSSLGVVGECQADNNEGGVGGLTCSLVI